MSEEQTTKETAKAYAAFVEYCALGPARSLEKLAALYQTRTKPVPGISTIKLWSTQHNWQERVKQYDAERAEEKRIARERAREEAEERHAREAQEEQAAAREVLLRKAKEDEIGTFAAVQWLKNSREDERKALGMDESTTKTKLEIAGKDGGPITILRMPDNGDGDEQKQEEASE